MSNRFHNKFHRHNHHTAATSGEADSSYDPIASQTDPFLGTFHLSGTLSATNVSASNVYATNLYASSATINVIDMTISELSGFKINGTDTRTEPPATINLSTDTLLILSGAGVWSENWGRFKGSVKIDTDLSARNAFFSYTSANQILTNTLTATDSRISYLSSNQILTNTLTATDSRISRLSANQIVTNTLTAIDDLFVFDKLSVGNGVFNNSDGRVQILLPSVPNQDNTGIQLSGTIVVVNSAGLVKNTCIYGEVYYAHATNPIGVTNYGIAGTMWISGAYGTQSAGSTWDVRAITTGNFANYGSYNPVLAGASFHARTAPGFTGTVIGEMVGLHSRVSHSAGAGTVNSMANIQINSPNYTAGGTVNGPVYGIRMANQGNSAWTKSYGLYIDDQSGSADSYSIYVSGGKSYFGGSISAQNIDMKALTATNIKATGNLDVTGTINYGAMRMASSFYISTSTVATELSSGDIFEVTLTGSSILANPYHGINGKAYTWWITQSPNTSCAVTLDTLFKLPSSASPTLSWSTTPSAMDMLSVRYSSNKNLYYVVSFVPGY